MSATLTPAAAAAASFDPNAWARGHGDESGSNPRAALVPALRESGLLNPGTPRERIRGLLGQPENATGALELYSLGIGFGANLEYLALEYDAAGRLTRAATRRM